jgi:hypothetical protein
MIRILIIFLFLTTSVLSNECTYKTETITENGNVISTKEIKVCEETIKISNGFWNDLMYSERGNEIFWDTVILIFTITSGG